MDIAFYKGDIVGALLESDLQDPCPLGLPQVLSAAHMGLSFNPTRVPCFLVQVIILVRF